jgi:acyl-CoA reductase-like NAD-dependent aldehyde dehydrogenase
MNAPARIAVDTNKLNAALGRFPRDRAMIIDGREVKGRGETIERSSPAHGVVVTRVPRGSAEDARTAIAAARIAFDKGSWPRQTASNRARVLLKTADLIDRDRESLRPRCRRSHIRQPGASGRACERQRLRPLRQCLEPGRRHSDWRRPRVRAGTIWVNTFMDGTPELPFGGYRQSGIGRELGCNAVKDYTEEKTFHVHTGPRTNWWLPRGV